VAAHMGRLERELENPTVGLLGPVMARAQQPDAVRRIVVSIPSGVKNVRWMWMVRSGRR